MLDRVRLDSRLPLVVPHPLRSWTRAAVLPAACRKNAAHILKAASGAGPAPGGRKVSIDVSSSSVLNYLAGVRQFWDIVFLDPPYELAGSDVTAALGALVPRLDPDAVVVLERGSRSDPPGLA